MNVNTRTLFIADMHFFLLFFMCKNNPWTYTSYLFIFAYHKVTCIYSCGLYLHSANECLFFSKEERLTFLTAFRAFRKSSTFGKPNQRSRESFFFLPFLSTACTFLRSTAEMKVSKNFPAHRTSWTSAVNRSIRKKFRLEASQHRLSFLSFFFLILMFSNIY